MKNWVPICILLFVPAAMGHNQKPQLPGSDGKDIFRACSLTLDLNIYHPRNVKNKREAYDLGYCLGLVQGVYANTSGQDFCTGRDVHIQEVLELTVKFVKAHPELQDKDAADIVRWALSDEFPCAENPSKDVRTDTQGSTP